MTWIDRLTALTAERGPLCVGIDPHPALLEQWRLPVDPDGLESFARAVVEALGHRVAVFKPQSAFFEAFGSVGIGALERVLADIRDAGALSILDVKRGDIGSTMAGYAQAYLADDAPLRADAITLSPYLGYGSLRPAVDLARETGRGVYVLTRTSNPEGVGVQLAQPLHGAASVAQQVIDLAQADNLAGDDHVGVVVGGTHDTLGVDLTGFTGSILVPGIGAQGGSISALPTIFTAPGLRLLPTASREVLQGGPGGIGLGEALARVLTS